MFRGLLILFVIPLFCSAPATAEIYKWRDANGSVHFSDRPPENAAPAAGVETMADLDYRNGTGSEPEGGKSASAATGKSVSSSARATANRNAKVEVYLTSWCPWCKKTVEYFQSRGISVRTYDIEKDSSAARSKDRLDPQRGVPTTVVNGQVIHGYAPGAFESALKDP